MSSDSDTSPLVRTWAEVSSHMLDSVVAANRAAFAAFGPPGESGTLPPVTERIEADEDLPEWSVSTNATTFDDIDVGTFVEFTKTISEADVERFAAASGDTNPLHLDESFAGETRFGDTIAHGTLVGGLISAALARLPGLVVYLSQDLEFRSPVRIGDRVTARVEIVETLDDGRYRLETTVVDGDETIIDGEAVVLIDEPPE